MRVKGQRSLFLRVPRNNVSRFNNTCAKSSHKIVENLDSWRKWVAFVGDVLNNYDTYNSPKVSPVFTKQLHDNRPYINIDIFGVTFTALVDSGANNSVIGKDGLSILQKFNISISNNCLNSCVTTADGSKQAVAGICELPVCIGGKCQVVSFLVVPTLKHSILLGMDFCRQFQLVMNFKDDSWSISSRLRDVCIVSDNSPQTTAGGLETESRDFKFTVEQEQQVKGVIGLFQNISSDDKLGLTSKIVHTIETDSEKPFKLRQYNMSPYLMEILNKALDKMLRLGVVEPSQGAYNSPVLLVRKSNGEYRFCFDGRKLNSITKPDCYPLPRVDRILNLLRDAKFISSVDLRSSFWQIPLDPASREKTGFSVPGRGLFQFKVLPFGLCNAAQTQQRLMDAILGPKYEPNIFVYLDDIIIVSSTFEHHIQLLKDVHRALREANLTVNFKKCEFFKPQLRYLGFVVDKEGIRTDEAKVSTMLNYPRPTNTTEVKRFLGMCSWYRRFVAHHATLIAPLNDLLKGKRKGEKIRWNDRAEKAFLKIKQALVSAPILRSPDFSKRFTVQCDASDTGVAGVLTQEVDGAEVVIAYCSRALSRAERNYTVSERELLAMLFSIEKFRPYIEGVRFTLITDHYSLLYLNRLREPAGRLARWAVKLAQYSFDLVHRKGKFNVVPDALSRISTPQVNVIQVSLDDLDPWFIKMRNNVKRYPERYPQWQVIEGFLYKHIASKIPLKCNVSEWKLVVPSSARKNVIRSCHDPPTASHLGFYKTLSRIRLNYYWPNMGRDVLKFVRNCKVCGSQKSPNCQRFGLMGSPKNVKFPWQVIAIDIMGPFVRSSRGNAYLLVVSDWFTKYTLLFPMRQALASTVVRLVENNVFLVYGVPQFIICDNGVQFAGTEFKDLAKTYSVQKIWYNARYHAQVNFVERCNRTIACAIRSYVKDNQKHWDRNIPQIQYAINSSVHEVTSYSPSFLNFARVVPISGDFYGKVVSTEGLELMPDSREDYVKNIKGLKEIYDDICVKLESAYQKNARTYNLRKRDVLFNVGDRVWRRNRVLSDKAKQFSSKLAPKYVLCTVRERKSRLVYGLNNIDGSDAGYWHVKDLKVYLGSNSDLSVGSG